MALVTDQNNLFNLIGFKDWKGQFSGSWGSQDFASSFATPESTYVPTIVPLPFNTRTEPRLTHGFNTYFKMQGYNSSSSQYEVWFSRSTPLLIPPSGNALSNIEIILTWIDR